MKNVLLADKIRDLRKEHDWSQAQLAEIASLSIRTIQRLENTGKCSYETLLSVAAAFDMKVQELTKLLSNNENNGISLPGININMKWLTPSRAFFIGITAVFPSLYFIMANLLHYGFGFTLLTQPFELIYNDKELFAVYNMVAPIVFIGGLTLAIFLNLFSIISFYIERKGEIINTSIKLRTKLLNFLVITLSISSMLILFGYVFSENFILR